MYDELAGVHRSLSLAGYIEEISISIPTHGYRKHSPLKFNPVSLLGGIYARRLVD